MSKATCAWLLFAALWLLTAPPAAAQQDSIETKQERLREIREEKAERLDPPVPPGRFERLLGKVGERLNGGGGAGAGFYGFRPRLGGLKTGAGIAGGIVYDPFEATDPEFFQVDLIASIKRYWGTGIYAGYRWDWASVLSYGRYRHMPSEDFFGFGGSSSLDDQSNFRLNETVGGVLFGLRKGETVSGGIRSSYIVSKPGPGKDEDYPSTTTWAAPFAIPSLEETAQHAAIGVWLELDTRDPKPDRRAFRYLTPTEPDMIGMPFVTDRGVHVLADLVHYASVNDEPFGFTRLALQSQQYVPFRHGRNVFAFREYLALSRTDAGSIPLYMLPALGGAYTIRGFEQYRFRDRHALLLNAEYRWHVWIFTDLALFADAGQVFNTVEDVSFDELHASYGAGIRLRSLTRGLARVEVARSVEGTQIHIRLSAYF